MRPLRWFSDRKTGKRSAIDYRNMGPEELGSVYESLLELVPQLDLPARTFGFAGITDTASTSGNARKTTGSYYTPDSLVQELIKSALDPVIADRLAAQPDRPVDALLSLTVCDPSCGSGHFLLAAARRLAEKLAELRAPDGATRPDDYRHALREVASRCLYGVDINPMAVELCRVALWLETVDPGKPLGFLNHHIRTGNSLLGTTPDLIAAGLPDDTFTAIEGDDKPACAELKKRNKKEREGFGPLFEQEEQSIRDRLRHAATQIEAMDDSQPAALQQKEAAFTTSETAPEYRHAKLLADLWCAAFVIKKHHPAAEGEAESAPSSVSDLPSPVEGHLLHTDDDLFGQSTPTPEPKAASKKQPRTRNSLRHHNSPPPRLRPRQAPPRRPPNRSRSPLPPIPLLPLAPRLPPSLRPRWLFLHTRESAVGASKASREGVVRGTTPGDFQRQERFRSQEVNCDPQGPRACSLPAVFTSCSCGRRRKSSLEKQRKVPVVWQR